MVDVLREDDDSLALKLIYNYVFCSNDLDTIKRMQEILDGTFVIKSYSMRTFGFLRKVQNVLLEPGEGSYQRAANFFSCYIYNQHLCFEVCLADRRTYVDLARNFMLAMARVRRQQKRALNKKLNVRRNLFK